MDLRCISARGCSIIIALIISSVFFVFLVFFSNTILPSASQVKLTVFLDHSDRLQLYYWNGLRKVPFQEQYSVKSKKIQGGTKKTVVFSLKNVPVNRMRLDLGGRRGSVKLYQLIVSSHFAKPVVLSPTDIYRIFQVGHEGMHISLKQGYVEVTSQGEDPYLISSEPLNKKSFLLYGLPLIATALFFLVVQRFDYFSFPAISDIEKKQPSIGENINSLDGLRAFAAIMVVADHTWGLFTGLGAGGVWIFMSLSGFLLARPFIHQPERILSAQYVGHFFLRRVQRVVPVYYVYIIIIYILTFRFDVAFRHFLFLQGNGHLWVVPQEMFFYLLVPIIMTVNFVVLRNKPWLIIAGLTVLMVLANQLLDNNIISLYGMAYRDLRFYLGIFLAGVIASYLYYSIYFPLHESYLQKYDSVIKPVSAWVTVILLLFFLLCTTKAPWGGQRVLAREYFPWFGIAAGTLIFSILAARGTLIDRILSSVVLRAIGLVSFSLYIFHPLVINCLRKGVGYYSGYPISGVPLFVSTLVVSYIVACFAYTYIERPFLH